MIDDFEIFLEMLISIKVLIHFDMVVHMHMVAAMVFVREKLKMPFFLKI